MNRSIRIFVTIAGLLALLAGMGCTLCPLIPQPPTPTPVSYTHLTLPTIYSV